METSEIKDLIEKRYPSLAKRSYYLKFLDEMLSYLDKLEEMESSPENKMLTWTYPETIQVQTLNEAADRIKYHLIEKNEQYIWNDDSPKNEYERGLYNAMRLLHQIVHWTNPS